MRRVVSVIDNNTAIRLLLQTILGKDNSVYLFGNGASVIRFLSNKILPDVMIVNPDVMVSEEYTLLEYLKSTSIYADIPIILLSEKPEHFLQSISTHYECEAYVRKPFNPAEITDAVDKILLLK